MTTGRMSIGLLGALVLALGACSSSSSGIADSGAADRAAAAESGAAGAKGGAGGVAGTGGPAGSAGDAAVGPGGGVDAAAGAGGAGTDGPGAVDVHTPAETGPADSGRDSARDRGVDIVVDTAPSRPETGADQRPADATVDGATDGTTSAGCGAKPGPGNTGVPAGTVLTPSGSLTITKAGTVIDGLDVAGCVQVKAANVVIRNTRITCSDYYPLEVMDGASLLIEDSEIAASGGSATSGIAFANYVARRMNIHGAADGVKSDSNVLVEASWIHDLWLGAGDHADGAQSTGGANVTFRCNFIDIVDHGQGHGGDGNACFQVGTEGAPDSNFVIDSNWLSGGGWVINMGGGGPGNKIVNNRFTREYGYGPISVRDTDPTHVEISGNVWDDTSAPVN